MVVHPSPGHYTGTLVNGLMYQIKDLSGINGEIRPVLFIVLIKIRLVYLW